MIVMPFPRPALALVLAACLFSSGCLVCLDYSFLDGVPNLQAALEEGPACISPLDYLFLILYAVKHGGDDGYIPPGEFLVASGGPVFQQGTESGLFSITYGMDGVGRGRRISSALRGLHAAVEPYSSARARYFDGETPTPAPRRVFFSDAGGNSVAVLDPATGNVVHTIRVGSSPRGMAFAPGGGRLFVANHDSSSISVVDLAALATVDSFGLPGGGDPEGLAMAPDGSRLYAVNSATTGELLAIDPETGEVVSTLRAGREPTVVRLSPDGATAYVVNAGAGTILVVDALTFTTIGNIAVNAVTDIAVSADGTKLYASGGGSQGKAFEIDAATFQTLRQWDLGDTPESLTLTPDELYLVASNSGSDFGSLVPLAGGEPIELPAIEGLGPAAVVPVPVD